MLAPAVNAESGYDRRIGRYGADLARALIAAAGVRPRQRVLDVGCGGGALTAALADVAGPANVVGVDPDGEAVALAARRLPGVRAAIRREFVERLGGPDGPFELSARAWYVLGRAPSS